MDIQKRILDFCNQYNIKADAQSRLLDMVSEVGELAKEILKSTNYGKQNLNATSKDMELEIGDVFFSLICLANTLDVDLINALNQVLEKYKTRIVHANNPGSDL